VVRIAPNQISFASPVAAKEILTAGKGYQKTKFYSVFPPAENPDIFTEIKEDKHARMKRVAVTPYSLASMQNLGDRIEETEQELLEKISGFAVNPGSVCDLGDWLHYFAFDVSFPRALKTPWRPPQLTIHPGHRQSSLLPHLRLPRHRHRRRRRHQANRRGPMVRRHNRTGPLHG
jgi:hypothetical protein